MSHPSLTVIVSATFWLTAVLLMLIEHANSSISDGTLSHWAVLVALGATCWTVSALINHARRVVLDVVSWEHRETRGTGGPVAPVIPLQRIHN